MTRMLRCRRLGPAASLLVLVLLSACDRGFSFRPAGWTNAGNSQWTRAFGEIEIRTGGIADLIGVTAILPTFEVINHGRETVLLETAVLAAGGETYPARMPGKGEVEWRTVPPGTTRRISPYWEFGRAALDILEPGPTVVLGFREGSEGQRSRRVEIAFERVR